MAENKMIYGLKMNCHQLNEHTIMVYAFGVDERYKKPICIEHPDKHPNRVKSDGQPYVNEHGYLFNFLKMQLVAEGKWEEGDQ